MVAPAQFPDTGMPHELCPPFPSVSIAIGPILFRFGSAGDYRWRYVRQRQWRFGTAGIADRVKFRGDDAGQSDQGKNQ